jgi:hypothetical protein
MKQLYKRKKHAYDVFKAKQLCGLAKADPAAFWKWYRKRAEGVNGITSEVVATLTWPSVGVKPNTWKSWDLESTGTPECSDLDSKGQNTSHWGVLGVVGKVLKRRYRKWPRIDNSDICSPSYGQKKGRESNWQFDSRPLKSRESMPSRHPNRDCDTSLERSRRGLQVWFRHRRDPTLQSGVMAVWNSGSPAKTKSGLHFGSPRNLCHSDVVPAE